MNSFDQLSVSMHQWLSFSALFAGSTGGESLFWPGCAAMRLGPEAMLETYRLLRSVEPMGFSTFCCGKPSLWAGSERSRRVKMAKLTCHLSRPGLSRIFTLCPNCLITLQPIFKGQVYSAWPLIERHLKKSSSAPALFMGVYALHDPCGARKDDSSHQSVRGILTKLRINFEEMANNRQKTLCCGRANMLFLKDKAKAGRLLNRRLEQANSRDIITYCESCVEAFKGGGHPSHHLLEAVFNRDFKRSWLRRWLAVRALHRESSVARA